MPPRINLPVPSLPTDAEPAPPRAPLLPERSDFLEGDAPAAAKVEAFLARALAATGSDATITAGALVPGSATRSCRTIRSRPTAATSWTSCGTCRRRESTPLEVTADHVKLYKRALLEAGMKSATVARRLSVLRGTYKQLAAKGLVSWETAQDIAAVKAPGVQKNSTPSLTQRQAISMLEAIPTDTLQGMRDLALMSVFFLTGCRVSAVVGACVGHLETDGVEHYLNVTEKRNKKRRKILLDAARPVLAYLERAGIGEDKEGPLFRPMKPDGSGVERRHLDRKTPWRLVKKYCEAAGIDPDAAGRPGHRHSLATQDGDQRRHQERGHDARGAGVRRARRYPHHRGLFRAQGGRRRGGGAAHPHSRHGTQGRVSPWHGPTRIQTRSPSMIVLVPLLGFTRYEQRTR